MTMDNITDQPVARINGVALNAPDEAVSQRGIAPARLHRVAAPGRAVRRLAGRERHASADGVISEAAANAIDTLLAQKLNVPEPSDEACRRYYAARASAYRTGERVRVRHILFAVTPGVDVAALRKRAEAVFLDVRCHDDQAADRFAEAARQVVQLSQRRTRR